MDLENLLRRKDAELEERANLLLKTKVAIEHLQEELASNRRSYETQQKNIEQQAQQLRDTERHLQLVESELERKSSECTDILGDNLSLKRKIQELQDFLAKLKDDSSANLNALKAKLASCEISLEAAQTEIKYQSNQIQSLQSELAEKSDLVSMQKNQVASIEEVTSQLRSQVASLTSSLELVQQEKQSLEAVLQRAHIEIQEEVDQLKRDIAREKSTRMLLESQLQETMDTLAAEREDNTAEVSSWRRQLREAQEKVTDRLENCESSWSARYEKLQLESDKRLDECKREWTRKYYVMEGEWFKKLQAANHTWAIKLEAVGREWMQRYDADRIKWDEERSILQNSFDDRIKAAAEAHAADVQKMKQQYDTKAASVEAKFAADINSLERSWSQRLEAALAASEQEKKVAQRGREVELNQQVDLGHQELAEVKLAGHAAVAEVQAQWAAKLAAEEKRWLQEKHELDKHWSEKLHAVEKAASDAQAALRAQIESRVTSVTHQVVALAKRDAKREANRGSLLRQLTELQALSEDEQKRRCEVESALHEASSIFKKELEEKNEQLDVLRNELRHAQCYPNMASSYSINAPLLCRPCSGCAGAWYGRQCSHLHKGHMSHAVQQDLYFSLRNDCHAKVSSAGASAAHSAKKEAAALRAARIKYQQALLEQQEERTALLRSINDALKEEACEVALPAHAPRLRGKWKVEVATQIQNLVQSTPSSPTQAAKGNCKQISRPYSAAPDAARQNSALPIDCQLSASPKSKPQQSVEGSSAPCLIDFFPETKHSLIAKGMQKVFLLSKSFTL